MPYYLKKNGVKNEVVLTYEKLFCENMSWNELSVIQNKIYKLAKKYGLVREFKENGIL